MVQTRITATFTPGQKFHPTSPTKLHQSSNTQHLLSINSSNVDLRIHSNSPRSAPLNTSTPMTSPQKVPPTPKSIESESLPRAESVSQVYAQTSFFNALIRTGYQLELLHKSTEWKSYLFKFSAEACALESREDKDNPNSKLLSHISLRKFALSYASDPLRFAIKTPNKCFQCRVRDQPTRTLWLSWLKGVQSDSDVMADHARQLNRIEDVITTKDTVRPAYWIPHHEADFCACCLNEFKAFGGKHTCRDCGYMFCSNESCFTDGPVKRCNSCLTSYGAVNADGVVKRDGPVPPIFNIANSSRSRTYFQDVNIDPLIAKQEQMRKEAEENKKTQIAIDQGGLTTVGSQTVYVGEDVINNKAAIVNLLSKTSDPKQRLILQQQKQKQLFTQREVQRVEVMKKISHNTRYGDFVILFGIAFLILYFLCWEQVKDLLDTLIKFL